jgi:beta-galactosidase
VSMPVDEDSEVQFDLPGLNGTFSASVWADILQPTTAKPAAHYTQGYYSGQVAVTVNAFGDGKVIYLGTMGDAEFYENVTKWLLDMAEIESLLEPSPGIEVTARWQGEKRYLFVLNHTDETQEIAFDGEYVDILSDQPISGPTTVDPFEVLILTGGV